MTYLALLFRSFYSPLAYRHMLSSYRGSGFGYLFFMISIITAIYVACALYHTQHWFFAPMDDTTPSRAQNYVYDIASQTPEIIIEDGILRTSAPQPYVIDLLIMDERVPIAVIDTDANPKDLLDDEVPPILITADAIHGRDDSKIESYYFEEHASEEPLLLNADIARELAGQLFTWLEENLLSNMAVLFLIFWAFFCDYLADLGDACWAGLGSDCAADGEADEAPHLL